MTGGKTPADLQTEPSAAIQRLPATVAQRIRRWIAGEEAGCAASFVLYLLLVCAPCSFAARLARWTRVKCDPSPWTIGPTVPSSRPSRRKTSRTST